MYIGLKGHGYSNFNNWTDKVILYMGLKGHTYSLIVLYNEYIGMILYRNIKNE